MGKAEVRFTPRHQKDIPHRRHTLHRVAFLAFSQPHTHTHTDRSTAGKAAAAGVKSIIPTPTSAAEALPPTTRQTVLL